MRPLALGAALVAACFDPGGGGTAETPAAP
jgi:hypothetical protein